MAAGASQQMQQAAQRHQMDDNFRANLPSCDLAGASESIELDPARQKQKQQQSNGLRVDPALAKLVRPTRRPPIRAASLRFARFNSRSTATSSSSSSSSSSSPSNCVTSSTKAVSQTEQANPVNQTQKRRQPTQTWPTSLISSLASPTTALTSRAVPITRDGVHQSIRLHRNTLLAERRQAANEQQVDSVAAAKQTLVSLKTTEPQIRTFDSSRLNKPTSATGGQVLVLNSNKASLLTSSTVLSSAKRSPLEIRARQTGPTIRPLGSSGSPACGRPSASAATTNSRVRQGALYARRQYHITPKTSATAPLLAADPARSSPQASQTGSALRLSSAVAISTTNLSAQNTRSAAAARRSTGRLTPLSALSSAVLAANATQATQSSKSNLALNSIHHHHHHSNNNNHHHQLTRRERFNAKPLKSSSKFSLTSSTSSLTLTVVKRVKPSEPIKQQVTSTCSVERTKTRNNGQQGSFSGIALSAAAALSTSNRSDNQSGSRHFLSARRGLSGSTLAAANRKPITRAANRNAASDKNINSININKSSADINTKNSAQTNIPFGAPQNLLPSTTTTTTNTTAAATVNNRLAPFINNNLPVAAIISNDKPSATTESNTIKAPLSPASYLVKNPTLTQSSIATTPTNRSGINPSDVSTESTLLGIKTDTSDICFINGRSFASDPDDRQHLNESVMISADNTKCLVDYKLQQTINNNKKMLELQQEKQMALNAKSNCTTINNATVLVKGPLGLHQSNNIDKPQKQLTESPSTNGFAPVSGIHDQVENLPPKSEVSREERKSVSGDTADKCNYVFFQNGKGDEHRLKESHDHHDDDDAEAVTEVVALVALDRQNNCCDSRSETGSTDSRKAMEFQDEGDDSDDLEKNEAKSDEELLSSSISMQRTNSLDSNLEAADEQMVLGSPLVTPPPSELDVDEGDIVSNDDHSSTRGADGFKIDSIKKDCVVEKKLQAASAPVAELSIPIRTESISDYYDLEARPFARGKFAQVKRCIHKSSQKCFAAKCIKKRRRLVDIRHEILLEIEALKLSYYTNHIVKLYEVYETPTEMILVLEMANGGELQRVLDDEEAIEENLVKQMVKQILEGLIYLHDNDIAHLDIKPQNLLLTESFPNGQVKLCDFGISRRITKDCEIREICGTPDYVAPEILRYDPISLATDIWSLGVLTYVLLSGYSPFGSDNKQQTFCNITQATLDFPGEIFDKVSKEAIDFMQKLIVREPKKRLTSRQARNHSWLNQ